MSGVLALVGAVGSAILVRPGISSRADHPTIRPSDRSDGTEVAIRCLLRRSGDVRALVAGGDQRPSSFIAADVSKYATGIRYQRRGGDRLGDRKGRALLFPHGGQGVNDHSALFTPEAEGWHFITFRQHGVTPSTTAGPYTVEQTVADATAL